MKLHYIKHLLLMLLAFIPFVAIQTQEYMNVYLTSQNAFQSISIDEIDKSQAIILVNMGQDVGLEPQLKHPKLAC